MITTIDGISFETKEPFDFSFLSAYGSVFAVFDKQDSGYLCFGVQTKAKKRFLKMAGASTVNGTVSAEEAITRLQSTVSIYEDLRHPVLIDMVEHKAIAGGYLTVFEWFEGDCMGKQYGAADKFLALSLDRKLAMYLEIVHFHLHVNRCGYMAVDFYDGSIMYDFASGQTKICDVELYRQKPVINTMGRMWGSSRFMSPEEFQFGAEIDERSNVFLMGATAFQLFGGGMERRLDQWQAPHSLYQVALQAVSREKTERYPSLAAFLEAWNGAVDRS